MFTQNKYKKHPLFEQKSLLIELLSRNHCLSSFYPEIIAYRASTQKSLLIELLPRNHCLSSFYPEIIAYRASTQKPLLIELENIMNVDLKHSINRLSCFRVDRNPRKSQIEIIGHFWPWVGECCLTPKWAIFQLYHGKNMLPFDDMPPCFVLDQHTDL
jgi:hypothetical protein